MARRERKGRQDKGRNKRNKGKMEDWKGEGVKERNKAVIANRS